MSILSKLNAKPQKPDYAHTLKQFSAINIGKTLDVSPGYIHSILSGCRKPGKDLDKRLRNLANEVKAELAES